MLQQSIMRHSSQCEGFLNYHFLFTECCRIWWELSTVLDTTCNIFVFVLFLVDGGGERVIVHVVQCLGKVKPD